MDMKTKALELSGREFKTQIKLELMLNLETL